MGGTSKIGTILRAMRELTAQGTTTITSDEIAEHTGFLPTAVTNAIASHIRTVDRPAITRVQRGMYRLTDAPAASKPEKPKKEKGDTTYTRLGHTGSGVVLVRGDQTQLIYTLTELS